MSYFRISTTSYLAFTLPGSHAANGTGVGAGGSEGKHGGGEVLVLRFDEEKTEWVKSSAATGVPAEFKAQVRGREGERERL